MFHKSKVATCLWFDTQGEEAAQFYVSLLPGSGITHVFKPMPDAPPLLIEFNLASVPYQALNGGPRFAHSEAASIVVTTENQQETDRLWAALTGGGGQESMCGWLKDRFGVSWQIVPRQLPEYLTSQDSAAAQRAFAAMMTMKKLDIAALEKAYKGGN